MPCLHFILPNFCPTMQCNSNTYFVSELLTLSAADIFYKTNENVSR